MENSEEIWMIWTEQYISTEDWLFKRPFDVLYYHFVYSETFTIWIQVYHYIYTYKNNFKRIY